MITIYWLPNAEPDVAGYAIYFADSYDGAYQLLGRTSGLTFTDYTGSNGVTWYYALTAIDLAGNESEFSRDVVYDTPRPEGRDITLLNYRIDESRSGYDFSTYTVGPFNDSYTDVYFEAYDGAVYLVVWDDTEIQDLGYTESLDEIGYAPTAGWSPWRDARVITGHTYVVRTWDDHYAKMRVVSVSASSVMFDWAYQLQAGNTRLKTAPSRQPLHQGPGAHSRSGGGV